MAPARSSQRRVSHGDTLPYQPRRHSDRIRKSSGKARENSSVVLGNANAASSASSVGHLQPSVDNSTNYHVTEDTELPVTSLQREDMDDDMNDIHPLHDRMADGDGTFTLNQLTQVLEAVHTVLEEN